MIQTHELIGFLDDYLKISEIPDISKNGLQVEGDPSVRKVAVAVDACLATFEAAAAERAQMLLVHHGIFWTDVERITGYFHARIKTLIENGLNLYAAHLPLDVHSGVGNNVELARLMNLEVVGPFGDQKGLALGVAARASSPVRISDFCKKLGERLNTPVRVEAFGPSEIRSFGIITGGGASFLQQAIDAGLDCFITGEPKHIFYHYAKETRMNQIFAGHYATETLGVKALAKVLEKRFNIDTVFIDKPTGL